MSNLDLSKIKFDASPNFSSRGPNEPQLIVLHCPVGTLQGTVATFKSSASKVSAHYVVDRDGSILQMVKLDQAAWHAMHYPNMIGIGIEMVDRYPIMPGQLSGGCMRDPKWMTPAQYKATAELVASLMELFNIPIDKVMGHNNPWLRQFGNNHSDPGPNFNMTMFKQEVVSLNQPVSPVVETPKTNETEPENPDTSVLLASDAAETNNSTEDVQEDTLTTIKRKAGRPPRNRSQQYD